ncbi:MAG: SIR2 family protein, partial [Deltaproteobacteria bacterium]|nr:SIR2 family protein [Deltaproteobacteria bacterium]
MPCAKSVEIAFLLGSGISLPAGLPSTASITDITLAGEGLRRFTTGSYSFGEPLHGGHFPDEYIPRILKFLKRLKVEIDHYYSPPINHNTNYEDLYYVASQIYDSERGEYDNPAIQPLIDKILPDIRHLLIGQDNEIRKRWELIEIAGEAVNYIKDITWCLLSKRPEQLDHLNAIIGACQDECLSRLDIFTLNHDTVLEQCLLNSGIEVVDGFSSPQNKVRYWSPSLFDSESKKVRLFKLHGSVDWFKFRPDGSIFEEESIGIPVEPDIWHTKTPDDRNQLRNLSTTFGHSLSNITVVFYASTGGLIHAACGKAGGNGT